MCIRDSHNTDLWRGSAPINGIDGVWPTGGAWLCQHLWEHYLFTGDKKFLARAYPDMKQASLFFVDDLVKDAKTGWFVTSPSYSPEQGELTTGPTMDNQLIRALMNNTIAAANILKTDKKFAAQLAAIRDQLPPNQIGRYGQLQEWLDDIDRPNNNHRHMSPLWALYPGNDITPADTNVFVAAKVLLQWRGDGSTGWSYAWRIPLWARACLLYTSKTISAAIIENRIFINESELNYFMPAKHSCPVAASQIRRRCGHLSFTDFTKYLGSARFVTGGNPA